MKGKEILKDIEKEMSGIETIGIQLFTEKGILSMTTLTAILLGVTILIIGFLKRGKKDDEN